MKGVHGVFHPLILDCTRHNLIGDCRAKILREEFWKDVQELTPQDTASLTREDAKDLQKVVQQVAQMDDDITSPQRQKQVQSEYDMIRSELSDVDI